MVPERALTFDEAAQLLSEFREGLSKNEWKRRVHVLVRDSKKAAKKKRDTPPALEAGDEHAAPREPKKSKKEPVVVKEERDVRLVLDCAFDRLMTDKELHSLSQQIRDCYSANRRTSRPCKILVASPADSLLRRKLDAHHSHARWPHFGLVESLDGLPNVIYLSSDAEETLLEVPEHSTLVIGGLVDRNRHKGACLARAVAAGYRAVKLPAEAVATKKPLTCNQVTAVLANFLETGSWKAAAAVVPARMLKKEPFEKHKKEDAV